MRSLITGVSGQDGSYLAEILEGEIYGAVRPSSSGKNLWRLGHLISRPNFHLLTADLLDAASLISLVREVRPDVVYHLAGATQVGLSFSQPVSTLEINIVGTANLLAALKEYAPEAKLIIASSSEVFGSSSQPVNEWSLMRPVSPYGVSKLAAQELGRIYRDSYNMHISNAILFNHVSARQSSSFLLSKVAHWINGARDTKLRLGPLDAKKDISHAKDVVRALQLIAGQVQGDDYVVGSGVARSMYWLVERMFTLAGLDMKEHTEISGVVRPVDIMYSCARANKLRDLGWAPQYTIDEILLDLLKRTLSAPTSASKS